MGAEVEDETGNELCHMGLTKCLVRRRYGMITVYQSAFRAPQYGIDLATWTQ